VPQCAMMALLLPCCCSVMCGRCAAGCTGAACRRCAPHVSFLKASCLSWIEGSFRAGVVGGSQLYTNIHTDPSVNTESIVRES
jgi:hypothetical protein